MGQSGKACGALHVIVLLGGLSVFAACGARRNGLSIAPPKVYSDIETRRSLGYQSDRVVGAAQQVAVGTLQQFAGMREVQQASLRGGFTGVGGGVVPTPPPAPAQAALPALPAAVPATGFGALVTESLDDLTSKEAEIESIRLLYAADTILAGKNARLYLVRFDIMLNPSRQNYFTYLWRPFDCFHLDEECIPQCRGLRNYTEDFQAVVRFDLPFLEGADKQRRAPVQVYAVQPTNQTLTTLDSMASVQGLELAAAAAWNGVTGQGEYQTRAEEQFAEQRKFPLIQGIIDSPTGFRFIFNPRRHTVRRSPFVSWIPGVGRYSTSLWLDAGVRRVYAYLLIPDVDRWEADLAALAKQRITPTPPTLGFSAYELRHFKLEEFAFTPGTEPTRTSTPPPTLTATPGLETRTEIPAAPSCSPTKLSEPSPAPLPIFVRGRYVRYGNPYRNDPLFFEDPDYPPRLRPAERETSDADLGVALLDVVLPIERRAGAILGAEWVVSVDPRPSLGHVFAVTPKECFDFDGRHANVKPFACDASDSCVALSSAMVYLGPQPPAVLFELSPLPKKPPSGPVFLRFYVDEGARRGWTDPIAYNGPWSEVPAAAETSAKLEGKSGGTTTVTVPLKLDAERTVVAVRTILFGEHVARVIDAPKRKPDEPYTYTVIVPESLSRKVDLIGELDVNEPDPDRAQLNAPRKTATRYVKLGTFSYLPH